VVELAVGRLSHDGMVAWRIESRDAQGAVNFNLAHVSIRPNHFARSPQKLFVSSDYNGGLLNGRGDLDDNIRMHGAGGVYDGEGTTIAKLVLHYADASERQLEIKTGVHARDWRGDPTQVVTGKNSELAWQGTNPAMKKYGGPKPGSLRIYKTSFDNPQPNVPMASFDYVSPMQNSAPFLIAITVV